MGSGDRDDGWNPECARILSTEKMPRPWQSERYWIDLALGAEVELPGDIIFRCCMDKTDTGGWKLRLRYKIGRSKHTFTAELGAMMDLTIITGAPCVLIPRAIKPAGADKPAAVMLEFCTMKD